MRQLPVFMFDWKAGYGRLFCFDIQKDPVHNLDRNLESRIIVQLG